mmetsp:Transcript_21133/g.46105  ORF Transcript_21133/g.46105 Transcript_21133/m.46105 type:complete len:95 (+) Transcript_21133:184-468(+)
MLYAVCASRRAEIYLILHWMYCILDSTAVLFARKKGRLFVVFVSVKSISVRYIENEMDTKLFLLVFRLPILLLRYPMLSVSLAVCVCVCVRVRF